MKILAFDQSISNAGWCLYNTEKHESAIIAGSIKSNPVRKKGEPKRTDEQKLEIFGRAVKALFKEHRPDVLIWEAALSNIKSFKQKGGSDLAGEREGQFSVNASQLLLRDLQGQLRQSAIDWCVPWEKVHPATWRVVFLGKGNGRLPKKESKAMAVRNCKLRGIEASNGDEAESCGIAIWARYHSQAVKMLENKLEKKLDL